MVWGSQSWLQPPFRRFLGDGNFAAIVADPLYLGWIESDMSTAVDIGTLIERSPEIRNGRPRIAGTGVTVMMITGLAAPWFSGPPVM